MLNQLQEELKLAMKNSDKATMTGLRNIIGKLKDAQINKGELLNNQESIKILNTTSKQLKESIRQYQKGGREDLVKIELFELSLIEKYLPKQKSPDEIKIIIKDIIKLNKVNSIKDMGTVMGAVMKELEGTADGKIVKMLVQEELS
tara:strand:- start:2206 stop:2643 length:438 start_codon:yes stop_codon:yes gene_type:complete